MVAVVSKGLRDQMMEAALERTPRVKSQLTRMYEIHSQKALKAAGVTLPKAEFDARIGRAIQQILK